jgi:hypothetical protein
MALFPNSHFSFQGFKIQMLLAKRAGVPISPPVRPLLGNPSVLTTLGQLQFHHADDSYKRLTAPDTDRPGSFGFAHPL